MLEVSQLTRCYDDFKAVDNVSFSIGKGEIVGLLGHNGAGKTTIMKMLSGYLEPNQGNILFDGHNLCQNLKSSQRKLGYLPENLPVYPEMTVADYLDYAAQLKGLSKQEQTAQIKRAILATQLEAKLFSPIATLSRGYKQRVGVAQAILGNPKLLILDEPTNGLDPTQTAQMRELICEIAKDATVILSTHIMQEVDAICDRALIVRDGQLVVDARLDELRESNRLKLVTSLELSKLAQVLPPIKGVSGLTPQAKSEITSQVESVSAQHYWIELNNQQAWQLTSAEVAACVIANAGQLFELSREQRNLETLFKQVNQGEYQAVQTEVENAA